VSVYPAADAYLAVRPSGPGCLVLDLNLPGESGLELQEHLATDPDAMPIVFLSGQGDVPKAAHAMKAGAIDFLTKPVTPATLLDAVARAFERDRHDRETRARRRAARSRYDRLTPREREVMAHVISGQLNKQIAFDLGTTEHTVKVHRQRVMEKLEADSVAALVRMADDLGIAPIGNVR
jgi:FixJ family two-component response regulator